MKFLLLLVPLVIAITCRSVPVVGKTLDWTKWGLAKGPVPPTGADVTTTTLPPIAPEAPWLKWAKLKAPVASPPGSSPEGLPGSAPAATPWSPWVKAKPIPAFIKPKLLPPASSSGASSSGELSSLLGPQSPNQAIPQGSSSLAYQVASSKDNDLSSKLLLESLGIPQQVIPGNVPDFPASPGAPESPSVTPPKSPMVPETFWSQLLKLTSPKVPKMPVAQTKELIVPVDKIESKLPTETPAKDSVVAAPPQLPVTETRFPPAFLEQFLKAFPQLSETLLKGENVSSEVSVENAEVSLPANAPGIPPTETEKIVVAAKNSSEEVPPESPSTPQQLFLQLLKLKGIPISSVLEADNNNSIAAATASPSLITKLPAETTPLKIPAAFEKLGLSEPVLSRLLQELAAPIDKNVTSTTVVTDSPVTEKNAVATESPAAPAIPTAENTPAPAIPTELKAPLPKTPPSNPETLWTEWLKLKTPKTTAPIPNKAPVISSVTSSPPTEAPEAPWVAWLKSQKPLPPVDNALPSTAVVAPKTAIPNVPLPVKTTAPALPVGAGPPVSATAVEILTQLLKLKTLPIPAPSKTPIPSIVPPGVVVPPYAIPGLTLPVKTTAPALPIGVGPPVPATPVEILTQLLKLKTLPIHAPTKTPIPFQVLPGAVVPPEAIPEDILTQWLKLKSLEIPVADKPPITTVAPITPSEILTESDLIAWIKSKSPSATANTLPIAPGIPPITISDKSAPVETAVPKTLAFPTALSTTPQEIWTEWLKLKTPSQGLAPATDLADVNVEAALKPKIEKKLPHTSPVAPILTESSAQLNSSVPDEAAPNVITAAVPVVVDGITIPAEVVAQLLKIGTPEKVPITTKPAPEAIPLSPEPSSKEPAKPISLTGLPVTVDGIPIPEQLVAELLKLKNGPTQLILSEPKADSLARPPTPNVLEAPWITWIKMNSPVPPAIPSPIVPVPAIPSSVVPVPAISNPIVPVPSILSPVVAVPDTTFISAPPEVEWAPLAPDVPTTPVVFPVSATIPETPEAVWSQLLKLNSTTVPVTNPVIEPPWIQWIKMKSPLPVLPTETVVPPADNVLVPPVSEPETLFASWLKPPAITETSDIEDGKIPTVLEPEVSTNITEVKPVAPTVEANPGVATPISEVSKVPIPVGLPETFWTELIKSYALSENKSEVAANAAVATEKPVSVDPWKEWLEKLDTLVSTPVPESVESATAESATPSTASVIAQDAASKIPLHNLTCCEWLAKLLPPNVLNETLKKLQQTRSVNSSPNPRHHHSSEENSSSEEVKRAVVELPEVGLVDSPPTTKPKLDIVPPGFWDVPATTEASPLAAFVDPAFWAAKKAMFISNLFSALAKVAMNATAEPPPAGIVAPPIPADQPQTVKSSSPVLTLTNNKARSASSGSDEESSESRLKRKSKKKGSAAKKRPFLANKQKSKSSKTQSTKPTDKMSKSKPGNKSNSHHSSHHHNHNHHKHHSVKKSSEASTAASTANDNSQHPSSSVTTTEDPVDFASLAKALLV